MTYDYGHHRHAARREATLLKQIQEELLAAGVKPDDQIEMNFEPSVR